MNENCVRLRSRILSRCVWIGNRCAKYLISGKKMSALVCFLNISWYLCVLYDMPGYRWWSVVVFQDIVDSQGCPKTKSCWPDKPVSITFLSFPLFAFLAVFGKTSQKYSMTSQTHKLSHLFSLVLFTPLDMDLFANDLYICLSALYCTLQL